MSESERDQAIRAIATCKQAQALLDAANSEDLIRRHIASLDAAIDERLKAETGWIMPSRTQVEAFLAENPTAAHWRILDFIFGPKATPPPRDHQTDSPHPASTYAP